MKIVWYSILTLTLFGCCPKGRFSGDIVGHPDFGSECNMLNKDENGEIVKNGIVVIRNSTEYASWKLRIESNSKGNCAPDFKGIPIRSLILFTILFIGEEGLPFQIISPVL